MIASRHEQILKVSPPAEPRIVQGRPLFCFAPFGGADAMGVLLACGVPASAVVEGEGIWTGFIVCGEDTGAGGNVAKGPTSGWVVVCADVVTAHNETAQRNRTQKAIRLAFA